MSGKRYTREEVMELFEKALDNSLRRTFQDMVNSDHETRLELLKHIDGIKIIGKHIKIYLETESE